MKPSSGSSDPNPKKVRIMKKKEDVETARTSIAPGRYASKRESSIRISTRRPSGKKATTDGGKAETEKISQEEPKKVEEEETVVVDPPAIGSSDLSQPFITAPPVAANSEPEGVEPDLAKEPDLIKAGETGSAAKETGSAADQTGTAASAAEKGKAELGPKKSPLTKSKVSLTSSWSSYGSPQTIAGDLESTIPPNKQPSGVKSEVDDKKQEANTSEEDGDFEEDTKSEGSDVARVDDENVEGGKSLEEGNIAVEGSSLAGKSLEEGNIEEEGKTADGKSLKEGNVALDGSSSVGKSVEEGRIADGKSLKEGNSAVEEGSLAGKSVGEGNIAREVGNVKGKSLEEGNIALEEDNLAGKSLEEGNITGSKAEKSEDITGKKAAGERPVTGGILEVGDDIAGKTVDDGEEGPSKGAEAGEISKEELEYILSKDKPSTTEKQNDEEKTGEDGKKDNIEVRDEDIKKNESKDDDKKKNEGKDDDKKTNEDSKESTSSKKNDQLSVELERSKPSENLVIDRKTLVQPGIYIVQEKEGKGYDVRMAIPEKILAFKAGAKASGQCITTSSRNTSKKRSLLRLKLRRGRYLTLAGEIERDSKAKSNCGNAKTDTKTGLKKSSQGFLMLGGKDVSTNTETMPQAACGPQQDVNYYKQYYNPQTVPWPASAPNYYSQLAVSHWPANVNNGMPWADQNSISKNSINGRTKK